MTISGLPKPDLTPRQTDVAYTGNRLASIDTLWTIPPDYPATGTSYAYDNAGNIVSDGLHTDFFYNQNNRLIRVEIDGLTVAEYAYDAFERRVTKVVNGVTTHFHYDLNGLLISETDGSGNPRRDYVYLNGEPVAMKAYGGSAGWYWFIKDHLGTPQKMVDEAGNVVWAAAYAPFGEAWVYLDEVVNNLRFPGQYYDVETGLHYNWHRFYDPWTGRYLRADPIGLAGGLNLYGYALNNPTNSSDPFGLTATLIPGVMPLPFPGAHPVFQPGTPENQAIGNDLSSIFRLMDPSPLVRDVIRMITGDDGGDECNPSSESTPGMPEDPDDNKHFKKRKDQAKAGDTHREVGDTNRTIQQGRKFFDSETGNMVHVRGNRVVITDRSGRPVTQFKNPRANTQKRIRTGRWIPTE